MIPMVDLKTQYQNLKPEIEPNIIKTLEDAQFILGPNVQNFEQETADYLGVKHAIGVANGTDALHLALLAAGIGAGDEVITSAFTFIATAEAISYTRATIKFADINPLTFNLEPESVKASITPNTKAILAVHLFGQPADIPSLRAICDEYDLKLIEDAAQSFGAHIDGKQTGSFGIAGCFSFFPSKNLGCYGDGGMISTNDDAMAESLKALRNHGSKVRYFHDVVGYNSRLDELQAVILRTKLKHLNNYSQNRRRVAHAYSEGLANLPMQTPFEDSIGEHVYHQYTILTEERTAIAEALNQQQIANAIYYPVPLHRQNVYKEALADLSLPVTESICERCLSLPIFPEMSASQIQEVLNTICSVYA